jgi:hypothetical protein
MSAIPASPMIRKRICGMLKGKPNWLIVWYKVFPTLERKPPTTLVAMNKSPLTTFFENR